MEDAGRDWWEVQRWNGSQWERFPAAATPTRWDDWGEVSRWLSVHEWLHKDTPFRIVRVD